MVGVSAAGAGTSSSVCSLGLELNILSAPSTAAHPRRAMPMPRPLMPRPRAAAPAKVDEADGSPTNVESGGSPTSPTSKRTISSPGGRSPSLRTPRRGAESPSEAALLAQIYNAMGVEVEVERAQTKVLRLRPSKTEDFRPSWAEASSASVMGVEEAEEEKHGHSEIT